MAVSSSATFASRVLPPTPVGPGRWVSRSRSRDTTIDFSLEVARSEMFRSGKFSTRSLEQYLETYKPAPEPT